MEAFDVNQSWRYPEGQLIGIYAEGAFLRHEFHARLVHTGTMQEKGRLVTNVFVNDMGREVTRCIQFQDHRKPLIEKSQSRWKRINIAFWALIDELLGI